jgi:hypothetical protein
MLKDGTRLDCELRGHGEYGWECQFLDNGEFHFGRRFDLRAQALQWADLERQELERDGWHLVSEQADGLS